ncbi:aromatic amino acid lyase [Streptomyces sp. NPDC050388]|uniref:aromatic amino acid lyase n=1 Tax=Streptomyces sp. NPDC050388 TaxID=3155781 RepID=UPI003436DC77
MLHDVASVLIDGETLTIDGVRQVAEEGTLVGLSRSAVARARASREALEDFVRRNVPVDGATSFGRSGVVRVGADEVSELQANLIRSHSTGIGPLFAEDEARAIVVAQLNSLAKGYSAVRPAILERLVEYLNDGLTPAVPEIGSLGAGGDATPLAHIASTLIGEGHVLRDGKRVETARALRERGVQPLRLSFKEGRALIGGTSAMTGLGSLVVARALDQVRQAEVAAALVTEALGGSAEHCLAAGHDLARPHLGQIDTAANLRELLRGGAAAVPSTGGAPTGSRAPWAYSLRAVPQVVGAVRHTLYQAVSTLETELNSAQDDPLFFADQEVFHGANGHGQPIAFAMDFATIALVQLGVLAERQLQQLLNAGPGNGLPSFLTAADPALHNGFAGAQFPASALVAENRTIGPASTQGVPFAGTAHDVVSMGLVAARGARRVLENNNRILAVEFLAAAQAVDVSRRFDDLGPAAQAAYDAVRSLTPMLGVDRSMAEDVELMATALAQGEVLRAVGRYGDFVPR